MEILWWHWLVLGLVLIAAELAAAGGFFIVFFGIAAVIVGLLDSAGVVHDLAIELGLFVVLSVTSLALFRSRFLKWFQADPQLPPIDSLIGEVGVVLDDLGPGGVGKVELRGSSWSARTAGHLSLPRGARCRVVRVDQLMLYVEPEGARS